MIQTIVDHAYAVFAAIIAIQVLFCVVPSMVYLRRSERKRPLMLGGILAAAHLAVVAIVALIGRGGGDAYLAWIVVSTLDIPTTFLFPHVENALPVGAYFALVGTGQYFLAGILIAWVYGLVARLIFGRERPA